jgi:hypothetical protein
MLSRVTLDDLAIGGQIDSSEIARAEVFFRSGFQETASAQGVQLLRSRGELQPERFW